MLIAGAAAAAVFAIVVVFIVRGQNTHTDATPSSATPTPLVVDFQTSNHSHTDSIENKPADTPTTADSKPDSSPSKGLIGALIQSNRDEDPVKRRADYAAHLLAEAQKYSTEHPEDVVAFRSRLGDIVRDLGNTPSGATAKTQMDGLISPQGGAWPEGFIWRDVWHNIPGDLVSELTRNPNYPNKPSERSKRTNLTGPVNVGDSYGSRLQGYIYAPADGAYTFWIASDDEGQFFLSKDENPENKTMVAHSVHAVAGPDDWNNHPEQKSAPITLAGGKRYFFEVLQKEGGGNDYVSVGWQLPWGDLERPVPGFRLAPYNPSAQPTPPNPAPMATASTTLPPANTQKSGAVPAKSGCSEYDQMMDDVFCLLAKNATPQALSKLEEAKTNPKFAAERANLEQESVAARYVDEVQKAKWEGATKLNDKTPLLIKKTDGKQIQLYGKTRNTVKSVKDGIITIEEDLGAVMATFKLTLEDLMPESQLELARIGLPDDPASKLKLAYVAALNVQTGKCGTDPAVILEWLDEAAKDPALTVQVQRLRDRITGREREINAEAAIKKLDFMLKGKHWKDTKSTIEKLQKEFEGTKTLQKQQPYLTQCLTTIDHELNPIRQGLWASYYGGDNSSSFKKLVLSRPETKLVVNWGEGSPDPQVPVDYFGIRFRGVLRAPKDGKYHFHGTADDDVSIAIDGKALLKNGEAGVELRAGEHEIKIDYFEKTGPASMDVRWKTPGDKNFCEIPPAAMLFDIRNTSQYEKE